jgi:hypothetical protein
METFYQYLSTTPKHQDQYRDNLAAITQASLGQMHAIASDLAWQAWGDQTTGS